MQITGKTLKPLTEAKYLNADNVSRYRAIMRIFLMHYDKLKYKLYQEEVYEAMCDTGLFPDYRMEQCRQDLDMLTEWKNLEAYQDTCRTSVWRSNVWCSDWKIYILKVRPWSRVFWNGFEAIFRSLPVWRKTSAKAARYMRGGTTSAVILYA